MAVPPEVELKQPVIQERHSPVVEAVVQVFAMCQAKGRLLLLQKREPVVQAL